jgi:glycosidase
MQNSAKPGDHGLIRTDFPGGWKDDPVNGFTGIGLTEEQKEMQEYLKALLQFRKNNNAIHEGRTVHFSPKDGVYVLFRIYKEETVVVILNKNNKPFDLDLSKFNEMGLENKQLKNVVSDERVIWKDKLSLKQKGALILTTRM